MNPWLDYDYNPFGSPPPPVAGGVPGAPAPGQCPGGFETFAGFCYYFGNHASYMAATVECQKVNAELVQVNDKNYDYLAQTIAANSGNDNWIGTGQVGGKQYKRQGTKCPIVRGSGSAMGSKISTLDCSVAAPFVCGYNPNPMPQYPAYGMPRPGMGGPGMGGYPMMPPQGGPMPNYPNYGMPPGAGGAPGSMAPPQYDVPEAPDYGVVTSATDVSTDQIATEEETGGGGGAAVYILIIALVVCAGVAYRYYKKNYAEAPPQPPKSAPTASKTDTTPLSNTASSDGKNVMGWKPPGDDDDGPAMPPKSFDNPVFREQHQAAEEVEADEFRHDDQLPPGMTMDDPRNPNSNRRKQSKRGNTSRYNDEPFDDNQQPPPDRPKKGDRYKEFEIPEGIPQWDPSATAAAHSTEMDSFEMGRHRVFDQMRSPAAGGPPNSMSMSRDYRQMYNDTEQRGGRNESDKECIEIELELEPTHELVELKQKVDEPQQQVRKDEEFGFFSSDEESIYSYGNL